MCIILIFNMIDSDIFSNLMTNKKRTGFVLWFPRLYIFITGMPATVCMLATAWQLFAIIMVKSLCQFGTHEDLIHHVIWWPWYEIYTPCIVNAIAVDDRMAGSILFLQSITEISGLLYRKLYVRIEADLRPFSLLSPVSQKVVYERHK